MADQLSTHLETKAVTLAADRHEACCGAAYEMEALACLLPEVVSLEGESHLYLVVRGISGRMLRLCGALMSGPDEAYAPEKGLRRVVLLEGGGQG